MKQSILCLMLVLSLGSLQAQVSDTTMKALPKVQLTNLYIQEVNALVEKIPYSAFGLGMSQMDIPDSKYLNNKRKSVGMRSNEYSQVIGQQLLEIIPYADKDEIIRAILYLRQINGQIRSIK